jgi:hypothetical protein
LVTGFAFLTNPTNYNSLKSLSNFPVELALVLDFEVLWANPPESCRISDDFLQD